MPRWSFEDPVAVETYSFEINPNEGGSLQYEKKITYQDTIGYLGNTLIFEGSDAPQTMEFSGVLLSQEQHETFINWFQKRRQILVKDDLGRTYVIYITKYAPKRNRRRSHPWHHSYTISAIVLNFSL